MDERRRELLLRLDFGPVRFEHPLGPSAPLGLGGPAEAWVEPTDEAARAGLLRWCRRERIPCRVLDAEGEPFVVHDGGIPGVVMPPPTTAPPPASLILFRSPPRARPAGLLLQELGVAGSRLRGIRLDPRDPNTALAEPGACTADLLALAATLGRQARLRFGVQLLRAFKVLGDAEVRR